MSRKGAVLFEVLLASVILSTGALFLASSLRQSMRQLRSAETDWQAAVMAANLAWLAERQPDDMTAADGLPREPWTGLRWSLAPLAPVTGPLSELLDQRSLSIEWPGGPGERASGRLQFSIYARRPINPAP